MENQQVVEQIEAGEKGSLLSKDDDEENIPKDSEMTESNDVTQSSHTLDDVTIGITKDDNSLNDDGMDFSFDNSDVAADGSDTLVNKDSNEIFEVSNNDGMENCFNAPAGVIEEQNITSEGHGESMEDINSCDNELSNIDENSTIADNQDLGTEMNIGDTEYVDAFAKNEEPLSINPTNSNNLNVASCSYSGLKKHDTQEKEVSNYHLKWFDWKGEQTPIVTQNENGPCPLLAIANVLILARKINLPKMQQLISGKQLMEYIGDCILAESPKQEGNEELLLNYEQNMQDAIDIMHKLQTGIDVNVKFSGVTNFEFTPECIVFDLLKIQLYHGWLVDPQDTMHLKAIGGLSYNQLVEKMLLSKDAEGDEALDGIVIEEFLARTASQLTYHGLCELNETIQEEELCVFFRNNHFSTLYKHKGELFLLVTDQGYLTELSVIWETLVNIEGDGQFVNQKFLSVNLQNETVKPLPDNIAQRSMSQEDRDYLIALSLQQDIPLHQPSDNNSTIDNDHKLALKLQEEENRLAQQQQQQQLQLQQQQQQASRQHQPTPLQQPVLQPPSQNQQHSQQSSASQGTNPRSNNQSVSRNQSQQQQQQSGNNQNERDKNCIIL